MKISLNRENKAFHYQAKNENQQVVHIDANPEIGGENKGVRPMELLLMGLGGCASIDLGLILQKQQLVLEDYRVDVVANRNDNTAKNFKSIHLDFWLKGKLDPKKVERAIELTLTKYCSVALSLDQTIVITYAYTIQ